MSELAPHHSTEKHVVSIHIGSPPAPRQRQYLERWLVIASKRLNAIALPIAGIENQWRTPACVMEVTVWRHLWSS
jgi:hypothetical protein